VDAITWSRREIAREKGLPISVRLLCQAHKRLMKGARGAQRQPGEIRRTQNWIGGTRPGNARFVPPTPDALPDAMAALERWLHADDPLPPLVRAGLSHVQFETIHPFLDGNGRIGRLLITLLIEHWDLLSLPLLYLSLAFRRHQQEYYDRLLAVRTEGDWEGWTAFFLECVREAADDGVAVAERLFALIGKDRQKLLNSQAATIHAVRLFDLLPNHPMVTLPRIIELLKTTKPTASKAIAALTDAGVLREITGRQRDRVYAYHAYLQALTKD
jgi:Fic family protein